MLPKTRAIWILAAAWPLLGMFCVEHKGSLEPLATARLTDIHLVLVDPSDASQGIYVAWSFPDSARVTDFEIFQSFDPDSMGAPVLTRPAGDSMHAVLPLPDTTAPYTIYFSVRAVLVEPTGQKQYSDTVPVDYLSVVSPPNIGAPAAGTRIPGRRLSSQVLTSSTTGILLRQMLYERKAGRWTATVDTCLPVDDCVNPIIGGALVRDTALVLEEVPAGETVPAQFCVLGTENFEGHYTGITQSLGCSGYERTP